MTFSRRGIWLDAVLTLLPGAALFAAAFWPWIRPALAAGALAAGLPFFVATIRGLLDRHVAAEAYPSIALVLLLGSGDWPGAAAVSLAVGSLRWIEQRLEARAHARAERPLRALGTWLSEGQTATVLAGECIPADGVVIHGAAFVDEEGIHGSREPVERLPGDPVFAGTIVQAGSVRIRSTRPTEEIYALRLRAHIRDAASRPSPAERLASHASSFSYWLLALVAGAVWFFSRDPVRVAATLLVLRPDALAAATSLAASLAVAAAGRLGALVRGGGALARLSDNDIVVFDRSRTVSFTDVGVARLDHDPRVSEAYVWECVAVAEAASAHPVGRALYREAIRRVGRMRDPETVREYPGRGVVARLRDHEIVVGTAELHRACGTSFDGEWLAGSTTPVEGQVSDCFLALDGLCVARLRIEERPRADVREALEGLRRLGCRRNILGTPDTIRLAAKQASLIGCSDYRPSMTPEERWKELGRLSHEGRVLLVSDGDDAAAAGRVHAAVALSEYGAFPEAATIALHLRAVGALPRLVELGRTFRDLVRLQAGIWVVAGGVGLALAAFGALTPLAAAAYALTTSFALHAVARGLGPGRATNGQRSRNRGQ